MGVQQGSVLSPILFHYYMEDLISVVVKRNIGCKVGDFTGILVYADDIMSLAPRHRALQLMVDICSPYDGEHNLLFSANVIPSKSKSKCLIFFHSYNTLCSRVSHCFQWLKAQ